MLCGSFQKKIKTCFSVPCAEYWHPHTLSPHLHGWPFHVLMSRISKPTTPLGLEEIGNTLHSPTCPLYVWQSCVALTSRQTFIVPDYLNLQGSKLYLFMLAGTNCGPRGWSAWGWIWNERADEHLSGGLRCLWIQVSRWKNLIWHWRTTKSFLQYITFYTESLLLWCGLGLCGLGFLKSACNQKFPSSNPEAAGEMFPCSGPMNKVLWLRHPRRRVSNSALWPPPACCLGRNIVPVYIYKYSVYHFSNSNCSSIYGCTRRTL